MDDWLTEGESIALLDRLFPCGLGRPDVMEELCPDGWAESGLRHAFHPTPERRYKEAVQWHRQFRKLRGLGAQANGEASAPGAKPLPDREGFLAKAGTEEDSQSEPDEEELARLVGLCLWDIVSDNHDLILPAGDIKHMGSFRLTAGIIADFFHRKTRTDDGGFADWFSMDYRAFYMGTWAIGGRADLQPVYKLIFRRLRALGYGWRYAFPRLGAIRFRKTASHGEEWEKYNPSQAFADHEEDEPFRKLQDDLQTAHDKALDQAKDRPPPATVLAYRDVYGDWPSGWPPWEFRE